MFCQTLSAPTKNGANLQTFGKSRKILQHFKGLAKARNGNQSEHEKQTDVILG